MTSDATRPGERGFSGNKYHRQIRSVDPKVTETLTVDLYCITDACDCTDPAVVHAVKKLLFAGLRSKGDALQDLREARDAVTRAIGMFEQDIAIQQIADTRRERTAKAAALDEEEDAITMAKSRKEDELMGRCGAIPEPFKSKSSKRNEEMARRMDENLEDAGYVAPVNSTPHPELVDWERYPDCWVAVAVYDAKKEGDFIEEPVGYGVRWGEEIEQHHIWAGNFLCGALSTRISEKHAEAWVHANALNTKGVTPSTIGLWGVHERIGDTSDGSQKGKPIGYQVYWMAADQYGRHLWIRHYMAGPNSTLAWCKNAAEEDAKKLNAEGKLPIEGNPK